MNGDVVRWPHGYCEAGIPVVRGPIGRLPACSRRGRWMVSGVILCGTCKRALEKGSR